MKPARGSARASTQGPKGGGGQTERTVQQGQKPLPNDRSTQDKSRKNSVPRKSRKLKGQENWKPLSKSSFSAIDNMLGLSILSVLSTRRKEKDESQKHLNLLKEQFLAKCAQLPVPTRKSENMMRVSQQFQAESQKIKYSTKRTEIYEDSIRDANSRLEELEVKKDRLDEKCRLMRDKLEEEEENAQEFTQLSEQAVLHLPAITAPPDDEPTLQEQLMKMVPNPKAVIRTLQQCKGTRNVNIFLELAHKQADQLLTTDNVGSVL